MFKNCVKNFETVEIFVGKFRLHIRPYSGGYIRVLGGGVYCSVGHLENFLRSFEFRYFFKIWTSSKVNYSGIQERRFELQFFHSEVFFVNIFWSTCRMTLIFFERKDMVLDNLPNTLNMVIRCVENFLRAFEKNFHSKNMHFWSMPQPNSESGFFKNPKFSTFPAI